MTNRTLAEIVKGQKLLILAKEASVQHACRCMWEHHTGSVLVVDHDQRLIGIFTGRDAVRTLAEGRSVETTPLALVMTPDPITVTPTTRAIDALCMMSDRGFRHLPILENGKIVGVISRGDFKGMEIDRLDEYDHLWECLR